MKTPSLTILIGLILISAHHPASAQHISEPVGFIKVNANASSDLALSFPLQRNPILQAKVVSVVGNSLVISASLEENELVYSTGVQPNHYFIRVHKASSDSGALNGTWYSIVANTDSTGAPPLSQLTVEPDGPQSLQARGLAVGDDIEVIPFWTLNTLFPNGGGLTATSDLDAPKARIVFYSQD